MNHQQKAYAAPTLIRMGTFEEVTQATTQGTKLDGTYPIGTPITNPILYS